MIKQVYRSLFIASVCLFLSSLGIAQAQAQAITGKVSDESGRGIPGVNVIKKGTTEGTTTDADGVFSINVASGTTLVFSFIGYTPQEVPVTNQTNLNITLKEDIATLSEVVVVGYGEMRKADLAAAQTSISSKDISRTINTTIDQAIQGRAAGVYVTQNSGTPGGGVSVAIRGINTITGNNEPLYVIDGVQIQGSTSASGTNPLSALNPQDIENLEILQGPNATAIYGSRGTNGVVLITTKRGKSGDIKVSYLFTNSYQAKPKELDMMNLQQYAQMYNEFKAAINDKNVRDDFRDPSLLGAGTNWQKELFQVASWQQHQISLSGGNEKSSFYLSGERMNQNGVALGSGFNRTSIRLNLDNNPRQWLSIGTNLNFSQTNQKLGANNINGQSMIVSAVQLAPDIPIRNLDGTYGGGNQTAIPAQLFSPPNPVALASISTNNNVVRTLLGGVNAGIKPIKGLEIRTAFNTNVSYTNATYFLPTYTLGSQVNKVAVLTNNANYNTYWQWNQTITYQKEFGRHRLNVMGTHEAQESYYKNLMAGRKGFDTNNIIDIEAGSSAPTQQTTGGGQGTWGMESYLGRINYVFDDRYIIGAAFRADGSANFGAGKKWGYFPSVSAMYRISNEKFFSVPAINDLRFRVETGLTGNQGSSGPIYGTLATGPSEWGTSYRPTRYANPNYQWEQTQTNNFGLTLGLFEGRIQLDADYYIKKTNNLILPASLPWYMGTSGAASIGAPTVNIGSLSNKGWSFSLNTVNVKSGDFRWETNFNISGFQTKIESLNIATGYFDKSVWWMNNFTQRAVVGQAPWQFMGYIQQGVYQNLDDVTNSARPVDSNGNVLPVGQGSIWVGDEKYKDVNNDGKIDQNDLTFIGSPYPKFFGGFTNTFSYKGFNISVLFTYSYGNKNFNYIRYEETNPNNINLGRNMFASTLDYAKIQNDNEGNPYVVNSGTTVARLVGTSANNNFTRFSNKYVEDGSYIRLKNISIGYTVPASIIGMQNIIRNIRVGVSAQNLLTFTKYTGYDPEVGSYVGPNASDVTNTTIGVDYGRYPSTRTYSFNIAVDF